MLLFLLAALARVVAVDAAETVVIDAQNPLYQQELSIKMKEYLDLTLFVKADVVGTLVIAVDNPILQDHHPCIYRLDINPQTGHPRGTYLISTGDPRGHLKDTTFQIVDTTSMEIRPHEVVFRTDHANKDGKYTVIVPSKCKLRYTDNLMNDEVGLILTIFADNRIHNTNNSYAVTMNKGSAIAFDEKTLPTTLYQEWQQGQLIVFFSVCGTTFVAGLVISLILSYYLLPTCGKCRQWIYYEEAEQPMLVRKPKKKFSKKRPMPPPPPTFLNDTVTLDELKSNYGQTPDNNAIQRLNDTTTLDELKSKSTLH